MKDIFKSDTIDKKTEISKTVLDNINAFDYIALHNQPSGGTFSIGDI